MEQGKSCGAMLTQRRVVLVAAALALSAVLVLGLVYVDGGAGAGADTALFEWSTKTDPIFADSNGDTVSGVDADDPNFNIKDLDYDSPFERMTGAEETRCPMCAGQKEYHTYLHSLEHGGDATDLDSPEYHPGEERERDPAFEDGRGRVPGDTRGRFGEERVAASPAALPAYVSGPKGALSRILERVMVQMENQARQYRLTDAAQRREAATARLLNKKRLLLKREEAEVQEDMASLASEQDRQIGGAFAMQCCPRALVQGRWQLCLQECIIGRACGGRRVLCLVPAPPSHRAAFEGRCLCLQSWTDCSSAMLCSAC